MTLTPEQFNLIATKEELKKLREDIKDDNKQNTEKIIKSNDELMGELKKIRESYTVNQAAHDRFEKRITKLEVKVGIPAIDIE